MHAFPNNLARFIIFLPTLVLAQIYSCPYCGAGTWLNSKHCNAALTLICPVLYYSSNLTIAKGDYQLSGAELAAPKAKPTTGLVARDDTLRPRSSPKLVPRAFNWSEKRYVCGAGFAIAASACEG
jgi:hypothetical protein